MNNAPGRFVIWLRVGAVFALLVVLLPLFTAVAFVGRFVLLAVAIALLVGGAVLFALSSRFREWLTVFGGTDLDYKGLRLAADVALSPAHAWTRQGRGELVVGSDDLVATALGPISSVELPEPGRRFRQGEPLALLRRGNRSVTVRAPVDGTVVGRNEALYEHPELVNDEPYADGWMVRMRGDGGTADAGRMQLGRRARAWFRNEVDRLVQVLTGPGHQVVMADGGPLVGQLHREIDDAAWQRLCSDFFADRRAPAGTMEDPR